MKIVYKDNRKVNFEMVAIGDVFSYNGAIYMSTREASFTGTGEVYNAINLTDGECNYFDANDAVIPVKAQLVIS